jgi:hypothetical protein
MASLCRDDADGSELAATRPSCPLCLAAGRAIAGDGRISRLPAPVGTGADDLVGADGNGTDQIDNGAGGQPAGDVQGRRVAALSRNPVGPGAAKDRNSTAAAGANPPVGQAGNIDTRGVRPAHFCGH